MRVRSREYLSGDQGTQSFEARPLGPLTTPYPWHDRCAGGFIFLFVFI